MPHPRDKDIVIQQQAVYPPDGNGKMQLSTLIRFKEGTDVSDAEAMKPKLEGLRSKIHQQIMRADVGNYTDRIAGPDEMTARVLNHTGDSLEIKMELPTTIDRVKQSDTRLFNLQNERADKLQRAFAEGVAINVDSLSISERGQNR